MKTVLNVGTLLYKSLNPEQIGIPRNFVETLGHGFLNQ